MASLRRGGLHLDPFDDRSQGTFGQVFFGRMYRGGEPVEVAVKAQKVASDERPLRASEVGTAALRERAAHETLAEAPGVLPLLGVLGASAPGSFPHALVMPRCDNSLKELRVRDGNLGVADTLAIFTEIVRTLVHAHARGIIHRDVSDANIVLAGRKRRQTIERGAANHAPQLVYLADWGTAITADDPLAPLSSYVTARWYRAPEIMLGDDRYDDRVDVWSAGVVACIILGGTSVWPLAHASVAAQWQAIQVLPRIFGCAPATWKWARDLPNRGLLQRYLDSGHGRGAVGVRDRLRRARAMGPGPVDSRWERLATAIDAALTLDPRSRPTAAQLLAMLTPGEPPEIVPSSSPPVGPRLGASASEWRACAEVVVSVAVSLDCSRAASRAVALRALELLESLDGSNVPLREAAIGCVWAVERYLETGKDSYGLIDDRARLALERVLEEIPRGVLSGNRGRFARVRKLKGGELAEIWLLVGMCDAGVMRAGPDAVAALCVGAEAPDKKTQVSWGTTLAARALKRAWKSAGDLPRWFRA